MELSFTSALKRYEAFVNSEENQKKLSYRIDSATRHIWTEEDIQKFHEGFNVLEMDQKVIDL